MIFLRAVPAARPNRCSSRLIVAALAVLLILVVAGLALSCGGSSSSAPNHIAYVTLPGSGSVLLLQINGGNGIVTVGGQTPPVEGTSPTGLALTPSRTFLYAINSQANSISIFSVASDGTLSLTGTPFAAGDGPNLAAIDPSGHYLLVTNNFSSNVSVYSINSSSGALSEVAGSPFFANANPTDILFTHSGQFVYVINAGIGTVTGFSFAGGVLTPVPNSPVFSGKGAASLAVDTSDSYLYVVNASATNPPPYQATTGNISGFNIDPGTGALNPMLGSPFAATNGSGPSAITIDPTGQFVYAVTPGSSNSIWCFAITPTNGELIAAAGSPFSNAAGGLFALFDPSGRFLYIGSQSGTALQAYSYNVTTGAVTAVAGSPFSIGAEPGKMVFSN
jgi:6-phosphogluconolactonase